MKGKSSLMWRVVTAAALVCSLVLVGAAGSAAVASPDVTFRLVDQEDGFGTACWDSVVPPHAGTDSVALNHIAVGPGSVYLEFVPEPGVTLADLGDIAASPEWSFWHNTPATAANWAQLELRFTACYNDDPDGAGHVDVTLMPLQAYTGTAAWVKQTVLATDKPAWVYYGNAADGTGFDNGPGSGMGVAAISTIEGDINTEAAMLATPEIASDWELTRVRMELWEASPARTCYIDDITIDGETYDVEQGAEYWLDPDAAYNVKTAKETYTLMGPCGPVDVTDGGTIAWSVEKGCGDGNVTIVDGGTVDDNFVTVRMNTRGDAHICVVYDPDGAGTEHDPIEVCAEKKWGEIYCTELTKGALVDDESCVTESVEASFLWGDCIEIKQLPADDAKVDWWLMDIDALAAVQALEAELGNDPCDDDGGCGGYGLNFFEYDVDGDGTAELYDSPREALLAIYAEFELTAAEKLDAFIMPDVTLPADETHETTSSDVDGTTSVKVHIASPTEVILATLTDYPIDKHGENAVCVQHETWVVVPPPTHEKLPDIAWAGEKDVIEWRLDPEYAGNLVAFYLEDPSVGTFESTDIDAGDFPFPGFAFKDSAWAVVELEACETGAPQYGVARVVLHSDKQGKSNVVAALLDSTLAVGGSYSNNSTGGDGYIVAQQGFIIYFLAFEEVELVNMGDDPTNDEAWLDEGEDMSELGVNESSLLRLRVKGFFEDPVMKSPRPEKPQDINGDGITDIILPKGRWILPDDYPTLAFGKLLWDLMDTPIDDIVSDLDENGNQWETTGDYGEPACFEDPVAKYDVIGPFSKLEPVNPDGTSWDVTQQPAVPADGNQMDDWDYGTLCRTTVVPDGLFTPEDANMPPAEILFAVTDGSGILAQVNKANLYQIPEECDSDTGVVYTNPYYWQEIPANPIIPPMYGSGLAGYGWASWGNNVNIDGPYRFWDGLTVWTADEVNAMNIFDLTEVPETFKTYTDNHGEAWVDFTQKDFDSSTIEALATYPYLQGDHMTVVSNPVIKISENLKDIKIYVDDVTPCDPIRELLYVFVRDYDGTPGVCEEVDWLIDGPYGVIEALLAGTCGPCTNACYVDADFDVDCTDCFISIDGQTAFNCTREMDADEIAYFVAEGLFADEDDADDYAIGGVAILSSFEEDVDVKITIWDCWEGNMLPQYEDQMVTGFGTCEGGEFDPWVYDVDENDEISKSEALTAVAAYFDGDITKANALEVIALYFD